MVWSDSDCGSIETMELLLHFVSTALVIDDQFPEVGIFGYERSAKRPQRRTAKSSQQKADNSGNADNRDNFIGIPHLDSRKA